MPHTFILDVPVKLRLELMTTVRADGVNAEGEYFVAVQSIEDRIRVENKVWFGDIVGERRRSTSHEPTEKRLT